MYTVDCKEQLVLVDNPLAALDVAVALANVGGTTANISRVHHGSTLLVASVEPGALITLATDNDGQVIGWF
jgi:hypothetical protein